MPRDRRFDYDNPAHDIRDPTTWDVVAASASVVDASGSTDTAGVRAFEATRQTGYGWAHAAELQFDSAIASSSLTWTTEPAGREAELLVETSLDQGGSWAAATNGAAIPGLTPGQSYGGKTLLVRCTFLDGLTSPHLGAITTAITWENDSEGNPQTYTRTETLTADFDEGINRGVRVLDGRVEVASEQVARWSGAQWLRVHGLVPSQGYGSQPDGNPGNFRSPFAYSDEVPAQAVFLGWKQPDYRWKLGERQRLARRVATAMATSVEAWITPDTRPDAPPFSETGEAVEPDSKPDIAAGTLWSWTGSNTTHGLTIRLHKRELSGSTKLYNGLSVTLEAARPGTPRNYFRTAGVAGIGGDLLEPGRTYHLAVTYDGLTCTIYIDGRPVAAYSLSGAEGAGDGNGSWVTILDRASGALVGNVRLGAYLGVPLDTTGDLYIGRDSRGTDYYRGTMTELRVWAVGISPSEVLARSNRRLTAYEVERYGTNGDLAAYYPLDSPVWVDAAGAYSGANGGAGYPPTGDTVAATPTVETVAAITGRQMSHRGRTIRAQYRTSPAVALTKLGRVLRASTTPFDVTIDGNLFRGVSHLGGVDAIRENSRQQATQVQLSLNSVVPEYVGTALSEKWADRPGSVYWLAFDADGALAGAVLVFKGRMDQMPIKVGQTATLAVVLESELVSWEAPHQRRMNDQSQQAFFPGDKGFEYVSILVDKDTWWPGRLQDELEV